MRLHLTLLLFGVLYRLLFKSLTLLKYIGATVGSVITRSFSLGSLSLVELLIIFAVEEAQRYHR